MTSQHTIGINVPTDEQVSSDQEKSSEGRIEQEKLAESVSMKESHHDFIQIIKELRKTDPFQLMNTCNLVQRKLPILQWNCIDVLKC